MMLTIAAAALAVAQTSPPRTMSAGTDAAGFELSAATSHSITREQAAPADPVLPSKMDLRDFAIDPPELVLPLSEKGPRLLLGAFGGRGQGMPKLAHVGLGWTF